MGFWALISPGGGATSSLPLSPPSTFPTNHASRPVPGRAKTEGAGSRQHALARKERRRNRFMEAEVGVGTEGLLRRPAPTCCLPGQFGTS